MDTQLDRRRTFNPEKPARGRGATYTCAMKFPGEELVAMLVAVSFAAGLNVYATVATLGLLAHTGVFALPPGLHLLASWYVIAASGALFVVEFFADKIPAFDLLWNALHTFIRVPVAALLAYQATAALSPGERLLAAHGGKTAARAIVTPSPEPFSNITLSLGEDVVAVFLTWMSTVQPVWAISIVMTLLLLIVLMVRWVLRAMRSLFKGAEQELAH